MTATQAFPFPPAEQLEPPARQALERLLPRMKGSSAHSDAMEQFAVNVIKGLIVDAVEKADSGHPGGPLSSIDFMYALWADHLKISPDSEWLDRDRFVLSGGHMSMLLYSFLHLTGRLTLDDLKSFRQLGSRTQGHPVFRFAPGIDTSTGPLGQGFGNAVGMAMAEKLLANAFGSELIDHRTWCVATDGDIQEGVCHEAAALAGLWGLDKLVVFYDSNHIQLASPTSKTMKEDVKKRFEALAWHVLDVADGHDRNALRAAIQEARSVRGKPVMIIGTTKIAHDTRKEGTIDSHGMPLGAEVIKDFKERNGHPLEPFWMPRFVYDIFQPRLKAGEKEQRAWQQRLDAWKKANPGRLADWELCFAADERAELGKRVETALESVEFPKPKMATRAASGQVLAALGKTIPNLCGGSADLANSTKTDSFEKAAGYNVDGFEPGTFKGRAFHFGVREHAMGSIANGLSLHGGLLPFTGTFLAFSDYMRPAIRLAAISKCSVTFIFTHDSVFLGEDGETHQPVEQVAALRAIPRCLTLRPADAHECVMAWRLILSRPADAGPCVLVLTRQDLPVLAETKDRQGDFDKGAYALTAPASPDIQVLASGSEVPLVLEAAKLLESKHGKKARVISVPSLELFLAQPKAERDKVVLPNVLCRLSVEAGSTQGWKALTGDLGEEFGIEDFGESAPAKDLARKYGFEPEPLAERMARQIAAFGEMAKEYRQRLGT